MGNQSSKAQQPKVFSKSQNKDGNQQYNDEDEKSIFCAKHSSSFATHLLKEIQIFDQDQNNLVLSPFSILTAMTIAMAGARNNTLEQMLNVMFPDLINKELSFENCCDIASQIIKQCKYYNEKYNGNKDGVMVKIANKIMIEQRFKVLDTYMNCIAKQMDCIQIFDVKDTQKTVESVNEWCAQNTQQMIKQLLSKEAISDKTVMIILNAIYFKGKFMREFDADSTAQNIPFYANNQKKEEICKVSMMCAVGYRYCAKSYDNQYDMVKLLYKQSKMSLILVMNNNVVDACDESSEEQNELTMDKISKVAWKNMNVQLFVPKFKFEYSIELNEILNKMGIIDAFDRENADFKNISVQNQYLWISKVIHKAVIEVNETGTEAAAATAVIMDDDSEEDEDEIEIIRFDHPFVFYIFDEQQKETLFQGTFIGNLE